MAAEQNMKYVFGAETGELDKGVNKIKREMRDLNDALADVDKKMKKITDK